MHLHMYMHVYCKLLIKLMHACLHVITLGKVKYEEINHRSI